jgi:integrase/recombinase XerC
MQDIKPILPKISGPKPDEPYCTYIKQFSLMMYQNGNSTTTIVSYGWHLHKLALWLSSQNIKDADEFTPGSIIEWGGRLRSIYAPSTQKQSTVATKAFFDFLSEMGYCTTETANAVKKFLTTPVVRVTPQRTLTEQEIDSLFVACRGDNIIDARDRTIISLLLDTGLRASELCSIEKDAVDFRNHRIAIVGKGGVKEYVYCSIPCQATLRMWFEIRSGIFTDNNFLFISVGGYTPGGKLTPRGLRIILAKRGAKVGVTNVTPHAFRRTFATIRIKLGQSTRGVQHLGRWRHLATFERYTQALLSDQEFGKREANTYTPLQKFEHPG